MRGEVFVGLITGLPNPGKAAFSCRNRGQIAVGSAGVTFPAQAESKGQIRPHLPAIAEIEGRAIVRAQTTRGEAKSRLGSREALAISDDCKEYRIRGRIRGLNPGGAFPAAGVKPFILGAMEKKLGKATALNMVEAKPIAEDVLAHDLAAVILDLMVALRSALRRQKIRPRGKRPDGNVGREISKRQVRSPHGVLDLVLEFQIREADGMREAPGIEIQTDHIVTRVVRVVVDVDS